MKNVSLVFTAKDVSRMAAAMLTVSMSLMQDAKTVGDIKEALELTKLSEKLHRALIDSEKHASDED